MPFVVDASVALSWCFDDETDPYADAVLRGLAGDTALVPSIWALEVANGLVVAERRGRLAPAQTVRLASLLSRLPVEVDVEDVPSVLASVVPLAREHGLSAYDGAYLELAARRGIRLATLDERLRAAAGAAGVPVHPGAEG